MAGNHAVGAGAAYGEGAPFNMADGDLQHGVLDAVVDGQGDPDGRNLDIAHDAVAGDVQQIFVLPGFFLGGLIAVGVAAQRFVIGLRLCPNLLVGIIVHFSNCFRIAGNGPGLMEGVPPVAYGRVQQQGQPYKKDQQQHNGRFSMFHIGLSLPLCRAGRNPPGTAAS